MNTTHYSVQYKLGGQWHSAGVVGSREEAVSLGAEIRETFSFADAHRVMAFESAAHANRVTAWGCEKAGGVDVTSEVAL